MKSIIYLDLNIAQKFGGEMELWDRLESRVDHATVGILVTILFIFRIILRYKYGAPALPNSMPNWQNFQQKLVITVYISSLLCSFLLELPQLISHQTPSLSSDL